MKNYPKFDCKKHGPPFGMGNSLCGECERPVRKLANGCAVHVKLYEGDRKTISDLKEVQRKYPKSWLAKQTIALFFILLVTGCATTKDRWKGTGADFQADKYQCQSAHQLTYARRGVIYTSVTNLFYDCMAQRGWTIETVPSDKKDYFLFEM